MDVSSEMIHSLLPIFLISRLGPTAASVGVLEGVAEATVLVQNVLGRDERLARQAQGSGSCWIWRGRAHQASLPAGWVLWRGVRARLIDRVGKGIRGAPRDALVADLVRKELWGASYGLRQSLDTVGA
jgi:hypothetical protein